MRVAVIATFLDEAASMPAFLRSLDAQTRRPDEVVLVDGGSTDGSDAIAEAHPGIRLVRAAGNRSVGRNVAIAATDADVVAATDLGCRLEPTWLERIVAPFDDPSVDVVMGWTVPPVGDDRVRAAVAVLTVPLEEVDADSTRPTTRSVAFRRSRVVPFPERYSHNEDAVWFAELRRRGLRFAFGPEARVAWTAPAGPRQLYRVVRRYGKGDGEAALDGVTYAKVAVQLATLGVLGVASVRLRPARAGLALALGRYVARMRRRAVSTLGSPSVLQAWVRVPAYGLVVKAAQVAGYAEGAVLRRRSG